MKKRVTFVLFALFVFFSMLNFLFFSYSNSYSYPVQFTGRGITGTISLVIEGLVSSVSISSPENMTYNFSVGENYLINLNVSSTFGVSSWKYVLTDLRHDIAYTEVFFTPNVSFSAVRWSNKITVYANDSINNLYSAEVVFFVAVPNSAPVIGNTDSRVYVCEGKHLSYFFNADDTDEDNLTSDISPKNPFYIDSPSKIDLTTSRVWIFSGYLNKSHAGGTDGSKNYSEFISVNDSAYSDNRNINITVIGINNAPSISTIGVQTVWISGADSSFYKQVQVDDTENGNQDSGNLTFNIDFLSGDALFNISSTGRMNFTPNSSQIGVYNISICVNDSAIQNIHPNISLCGQTGEGLKTCQNFSLTITNENRNPTITSYYPLELSSNVSGTDALYFNITKYDADGTVPDAYWYADNVLKQYNLGSLNDSFSYNFGCGVSGSHQINAEITDGLANDSVTWSFDVTNVVCPVSAVSGGGGGGLGTGCIWKWACDDWNVCQNTEKSLKLGILSGGDYRNVSNQCEKNKWLADFCGFQIRKCIDLNNCSKALNKPFEIESCFYVETPSCSDGVKNCHDDACEFLVDCGGPCSQCSTCSDKKQNQGEEGIDCGGPCPFKCEVEKPMAGEIPKVFIVLIIGAILLAALIIIIIQIKRIHRHIRKLRE